MIRADNLAFSYADQPLYTGAHFTVDSTQIAGLVGPNGAGKSTLLKIIMGEYPLDAGTISVHGKIGYVPQEVKTDPVLDAANSAREYLNPSSTLYDYELEDVLKGLEMVGVSLDAVPRTMSGGQKTKLALARALLSQPDILLLDEPTNFLDIEGKKWVMRFLSTYPHSVVIISHDLNLLDAFIDKVIYINPQTQTITEFNGNYSNYVKQVALAEARLKREITTKQKHIEQMRKSLQKMARFTSEKGVRRKTMLRHRMEKMIDTLPEMPKELRKIRFQLQEPARVGELPIMVKHLSKAYGDNVIIEDLSFSIKRGERMALIGYNGAGKSTLIKMLVGLLEANSGEIVKDEKLSFGYYSQEFETFDMDKTPIDVANEQSDKEVSYFRGLFGRFLLSKDTVFQKISTLSGGEKTRLSIALLLLQNYNLLILDEPTTYLDVFSQRVILEALKDYKGALLIVSHTEEFIRELKPDRALILPDEKIVLWDDSLLDRVSDV